MTHKPYPVYKDSGVEWIGEIPEEWMITKYKRAFIVQNGHGFPNDLQGNKYGEFPFLKVSDISFNGKYVEKAANYVSQEITDEKGWNVVETNSILTAKIGEALRKNHRKINKTPCLIDNNMMALIPNSNIGTQFLYYLSTIIDFDWYSNPGAVPSLNNSHLREDSFAIPSLEEQKLISIFLENSLAEINNLIIQKENMIQLIKEKRQAVITEAVTKGLNPNVPMKDSGIEWIGKTPKHWQTVKIKRVLKSLNHRRLPLSGEERADMKKVYDYYGASGKIDKVDNYIFDEPLILLGEDGANLYTRSKPLAFIATGKYWVNNHAHILKPRDGNLYYFVHLLEANDYTPYVSGSAQPKLTQDALGEIFILNPPKEEQEDIADFVEHKSNTVNISIKEVEGQIRFLKEYRESLIYEAVTGKIDLREYEGGEYVGD